MFAVLAGGCDEECLELGRYTGNIMMKQLQFNHSEICVGFTGCIFCKFLFHLIPTFKLFRKKKISLQLEGNRCKIIAVSIRK